MKQVRLWVLAAILVQCIAVASVFVSCDSRKNYASTPEAVALIENVSEQKDNDRMLKVADSLEKAGVLSKGPSCFWQGYAYNQMRLRQVAQYYWEEAMKATVNSTDPTDLTYYAKAASYLTGIYLRNSEFSLALQTAMPDVRCSFIPTGSMGLRTRSKSSSATSTCWIYYAPHISTMRSRS